MARRLLPLALLAALAIGGCSYGTKADITPEQREARVQLIEAAGAFDDHEFSRLCRGLYPSDFLTNDRYREEDEDHRTPVASEKIRALVARAGCDVPSPK